MGQEKEVDGRGIVEETGNQDDEKKVSGVDNHHHQKATLQSVCPLRISLS